MQPKMAWAWERGYYTTVKVLIVAVRAVQSEGGMQQLAQRIIATTQV